MRIRFVFDFDMTIISNVLYLNYILCLYYAIIFLYIHSIKYFYNQFIKYVIKITLLSRVLYYINQIKLFKMAIINYLSIFIH